MARFEVIKEITDSLANIVRLEADAQKFDLELVVGPPDKAFFSRPSNALALYLHNVGIDHQDNQEYGEEVEVEKEDEDGIYTILYPKPLILRVHYAVAATGRTPIDEQLTLTLALKAFVERPVLNDELKKGPNFPKLDLPIDWDRDFTPDRQRSLLDSFGVSHHPLLGYRIVTELQPERELRRTRKVERRSIAIFDKHRPPDGMGEGVERKRPVPVKSTK